MMRAAKRRPHASSIRGTNGDGSRKVGSRRGRHSQVLRRARLSQLRGTGQRPAIVVIDFSNAFTRGASQFPGGDFATEMAQTRPFARCCSRARSAGVSTPPLPMPILRRNRASGARRSLGSAAASSAATRSPSTPSSIRAPTRQSSSRGFPRRFSRPTFRIGFTRSASIRSCSRVARPASACARPRSMRCSAIFTRWSPPKRWATSIPRCMPCICATSTRAMPTSCRWTTFLPISSRCLGEHSSQSERSEVSTWT